MTISSPQQPIAEASAGKQLQIDAWSDLACPRGATSARTGSIRPSRPRPTPRPSPSGHCLAVRPTSRTQICKRAATPLRPQQLTPRQDDPVATAKRSRGRHARRQRTRTSARPSEGDDTRSVGGPWMTEELVGTADELGPGSVRGVGGWAVLNVDGERFAVSRRCRHLRADLASGQIDENGCLVCPWHQSRYDPSTGWSSGRRRDTRRCRVLTPRLLA
jgi:nitrite reductase/ring-hydroxylating ferredoxin subunit